MTADRRTGHELTYRDWSVLRCHSDGAVDATDGCGLYHDDCRIVSRYRLALDGVAPEWVSSGCPEAATGVAALRVYRRGPSPDGPRLPQDSLEIRLRREVGGGMVELIEVINHSMAANTAVLSVEVMADFADTLEVAQQRRQQRGELRVRPSDDAVEIRYAAEHRAYRTERGLRVRRVSGDVSFVTDTNSVVVSGRLKLAPHQRWAARLAFEPLVDGEWRTPDALTAAFRDAARDRRAWRRRRPSVVTRPRALNETWNVAADDLYDLRNRDLERLGGEAWVVNAGVPLFTGLFGRDALTAGWQSALLGPQLMRGALAVTARLQADEDDAWTDAEPGKLIHELRRGPLADLRITAQHGYYGTQTTAAMFPLILSELWHWTGDTDTLVRYRPTAERAMEWARRDGDLDGDGFLEYRQRSPVGIKNQAWKDSHEAIRYGDGRNVPNPIATVEEQAFHYLALSRMAEICVALDDDRAAEDYLAQARALRERWHPAFWMADERFYAMALDPDKRRVTSVGSNVGHALAAGMIPTKYARAVADRLFAPDMFSGWGIRTLSADHPSYNPWAYHLGTVWPVEHATFALGLKRYGFDAEAERLITAQLDAAEQLPGRRLPELIGGQRRSELELPIAYPDANSPQAWSASATIQLIQVMLGLYPFAPLRVLALVRPRLPEGIDELELRDVRVGRARVSLHFRRRDDGSAAHEVVDRRGSLLVVDAPPPDSQDLDLREQIAVAALAHAPGRLARAGRIALGMID